MMEERKKRTRQKQEWQPVRVLSIAGSDSGGGAGLQADIKTISALGGYATTAVTAITVQNTMGVEAVYPVDTQVICEQVAAVCQDIAPQAIKISMLPDPDTAASLAGTLRKYHCRNIVIDPVMVATSGQSLSGKAAIENMVKHLFPIASIVTPNLEEAEELTGVKINHIGKYWQAARKMLEWGPAAVLIKGGHSKRGPVKDFLFPAGDARPACFSTSRIDTANLHGTGCTLSAAIAFFLGAGSEMPEAVLKAKEYIYEAIRSGADMKIGHGHGPVNHFFAPYPCKEQKHK